MPEPIAASIRAELDQTPEWWQQQYDALVRKQIPRTPEHHAGHDLAEPIRSWGGATLTRPWCTSCGVPIERAPDG
ncbi:hypothetical protein [Microbacterium sp. XT11]|uniref:hypothetical protein n=1 Tax=Microbacterium sp. XT11 TaxID=367477 RepID=UPI00082E7249|nr:hypothetical protein [Microbacterium sp. XT11]